MTPAGEPSTGGAAARARLPVIGRIRRRPPRLSKRHWLALAFTGPALVAVAGLLVYPIGYNLWLSLHDLNLTQRYIPQQFVGLQNYIEALESEFFWNAVKNSLIITVTGLALELGIGFALALTLTQEIRGRRVFQSVLLLPLLLVPAVVAVMWRFMFQFDGVVNYLLGLLGISPVNWTTSTAGLITIIIVVTWQNAPFAFIILLAGLQSIDPTLEDAAKVDGAGYWQRFFFIILPLIRPFLLIILAVRTMDLLRVFDEAFVLTGGGPGRSTELLSQIVYTNSFRFFEIGKGAAIAFLQIAVTIAFLTAYFVALHSREEGSRVAH